MNLGKQVRLQRIFNRETGRAIIVPMDHGVSVGPIEGIENIHKTVSDMADGGADAVLMHKGLCRCCFRASGEGKDARKTQGLRAFAPAVKICACSRILISLRT